MKKYIAFISFFICALSTFSQKNGYKYNYKVFYGNSVENVKIRVDTVNNVSEYNLVFEIRTKDNEFYPGMYLEYRNIKDTSGNHTVIEINEITNLKFPLGTYEFVIRGVQFGFNLGNISISNVKIRYKIQLSTFEDITYVLCTRKPLKDGELVKIQQCIIQGRDAKECVNQSIGNNTYWLGMEL